MTNVSHLSAIVARSRHWRRETCYLVHSEVRTHCEAVWTSFVRFPNPHFRPGAL